MANPPSSLRSILEDLYQSDPDLRQKEAELIPLIEKLLALRPNEQPSAAFQTALKNQVLKAHAERYSSPLPSHSFFQRMSSAFSFKYLAVPVGALALLAIAVTTLSSFKPTPTNPGSSLSVLPTGSIQETNTRQAFGSLASAFQSGGLGAGGGGSGMSGVSAMVGNPADKRVASSLIAPPFEATNYKYTYAGELPEWNAQVDVYKRVKGSSQNSSLVQALAQSTHELIDLGKMSGLGLQSFTLSQATSYGYTVNVDLIESTININQNYTQWPHPEATCKDEACFQRYRLTEGAVPSDAELIDIANAFLREQGISTDKYGAPQVNSEWRMAYAETKDRANFYIPDVLTVIYPTVLDGNTVYDQGGSASGLMVNVNAREKRVDSVSNLTSNNYARSSYQAETDKARITSVMKKGGIYSFAYPEAKKTVEVELQNPQIVLEKVWMPNQPGEPMNELLIPALRFELKNKPENSYLSNYMFVPLVKEVLDEERSNDIRIMM